MERGGSLEYGRGWFWIGLAIMLVLIGVAAVIAVLNRPTTATPEALPNFGWVWPIFGVFFLFWVLSGAFSPFSWRRGFLSRSPWGWGREDALEILKVRYARGEIPQEEYLRMKQDLEK